MSSLQARLKNDTLSSVFALANGIFKSVTIAYFIYFIATILLLLPLLYFVLGIGITDVMNVMEIGDPFERQAYITDMLGGVMTNFGVGTVLIGLFSVTIVILIGSWFYNLCFIAAEDYVEKENVSFANVLGRSFNRDVIRLVLASLLISVIAIAAFFFIGIFGVLGGRLIGGLLVLVGMLFVSIFMMRFILTFPAIVHGNMSAGNAISFSWNSIDFKRALKYFAIAILIFVALVVITLITGLVQTALMKIPAIGFVLYLIISSILSAYTTAWTTAALSGLYFRHIPLGEEQELDIADHLID